MRTDAVPKLSRFSSSPRACEPCATFIKAADPDLDTPREIKCVFFKVYAFLKFLFTFPKKPVTFFRLAGEAAKPAIAK